MNLDALAIGAHPDDVELGCSGAVINLVDAGYRVGLLDLTDAHLSTHGDQSSRAEEARAACGEMGVAHRFRLGLAEGDILTGADSLYRLTALIRRLKPYVVLAPYWEDRHPDHADASRLVQRAVFWAGVPRYGDPQPPHRPHRVFYYFIHTLGPVSLVVDISSSFDRKLSAIRAYRSQFLPRPDAGGSTYITRPEFLEGVISRAQFHGSLIGAEYGEPYHVREMPRAEDLVGWSGDQGVTG